MKQVLEFETRILTPGETWARAVIAVSIAVSKHAVANRIRNLTMRLSDAGLHRRRAKTVYPNHRLAPCLAEDATRDRSNRLLDACTDLQVDACAIATSNHDNRD